MTACLSLNFEDSKAVGASLIVVLILMLMGALSTWRHSRNWGHCPSGGLGLVALIWIVVVLSRRVGSSVSELDDDLVVLSA